MIGKTLSHYNIISLLGKGGMGEVYQAKDTKLGRDVAIKVLPIEFAIDCGRVERFQREARLLASLNHPNIASIYGLEESGGSNFLVMELIEGDTLADRLNRGPIPIEETFKLALQIAEGIEAAHEKGVIHRDLKPANIKVTPDGKVKILDFGLAKAFALEQGESKPSDSPTISAAATRQGIILGTAAYMSPEQARGKAVDRRADIWAFGVVLFEMLTGQAAFQGDDVGEILASVIKGDVNLDLLPANMNPRVKEIISHCLQRDQKRRYKDVGDIVFDIDQVATDPSGVVIKPQTSAEGISKWRLLLTCVVGTIVVTAIIAGAVVWKLKPPEPHHVMRFYDELPKDQHFNDVTNASFAVSTDGNHIAYCTIKGIYIRSIGEFDAKLLIGTGTDPSTPFFSPDGQWVGYFSKTKRKLMKIAIDGGAPVSLCDTVTLSGASWVLDDRVVYADDVKGIMSVSVNGGVPEPLIKKTELYSVAPQILPDRKNLLFTVLRPEGNQVVVQSLTSGERKVVLEGHGDSARYISTGHIVYLVRNSLFAVPFDLKKLKVLGSPVPIIEDVFRLGMNAPQYAISDSGMLVYLPGMADTSAHLTLIWVDRMGKEEPLSSVPNDYRFPRLSPDGTKVVLAIGAGEESDIWIWDIVRKTMSRLTFDGVSRYPLWSPDGKRIVLAKLPGMGSISAGVYWKAADGTGEDEKFESTLGKRLLPYSWSRDGSILSLIAYNASGNTFSDVVTLSMKGNNHEQMPLLTQKYQEQEPSISPNGKWMAYASDESGQFEIYVRPFPEVNKGRWQVSTSQGRSPLWSPNGHELFYRSGDAVMVVPIETEEAFKTGKPEALFQGTYVWAIDGNIQPLNISPDGKRFLLMKEVGSNASGVVGPRHIRIVLNWFEELKQRVPNK